MLNSDNSFFKEKELDFVDLLSTITNEIIFCKRESKLSRYMSDKDKTILDDNNTFPQITDIQTYIAETETRILEAFEKGSRFNPKIEMAEQFLQQHVGSKLKLVALYVDLVDSTLMTRDFSVDKLATIIQMFTQEMSVAASSFNGQILKYVGDAVIIYFPIEANDSVSFSSAINCAFHMITIIDQAINPILRRYNYDPLKVRIGNIQLFTIF
jgi:tRNA threonylcarbamoyladenosine modification (KEOPS) complex  Pcc1 subunit